MEADMAAQARLEGESEALRRVVADQGDGDPWVVLRTLLAAMVDTASTSARSCEMRLRPRGGAMKIHIALAVAASLSLPIGVAHAQLYGNSGNSNNFHNYGTPRSSTGLGVYGSGSNSSDHPVGGYMRGNGTYVAPHYQTNPNSLQMDNYSARGNYNYHTGHVGTRTPRW
jgi:hypothetical protein